MEKIVTKDCLNLLILLISALKSAEVGLAAEQSISSTLEDIRRRSTSLRSSHEQNEGQNYDRQDAQQMKCVIKGNHRGLFYQIAIDHVESALIRN
jgi:hypothetical protein